VSIAALIGRGAIRNTGSAINQIKALQAKNALISTVDPSDPASQAFAEILALFFTDPEQEQTPWSQVQHWPLPEPIAAPDCLDTYHVLTREILLRWESYLSLQTAIDEAVADWYDLDASHRTTLQHGLPWAMREREYPLATGN
jgi:hypothetical protein